MGADRFDWGFDWEITCGWARGTKPSQPWLAPTVTPSSHTYSSNSSSSPVRASREGGGGSSDRAVGV